MKSNMPWFKFYSSDFLNGVGDLTMEERGQYITLLCIQHQKGVITEKQIKLSIGSLSEDVRAKFDVNSDGDLHHPKMDEVMQEAEERSAMQSRNAKKRWSKPKGKTKKKRSIDGNKEGMDNAKIDGKSMPSHMPSHMPPHMPNGMPNECQNNANAYAKSMPIKRVSDSIILKEKGGVGEKEKEMSHQDRFMQTIEEMKESQIWLNQQRSSLMNYRPGITLSEINKLLDVFAADMIANDDVYRERLSYMTHAANWMRMHHQRVLGRANDNQPVKRNKVIL